jgi:hypothetical protein
MSIYLAEGSIEKRKIPALLKSETQPRLRSPFAAFSSPPEGCERASYPAAGRSTSRIGRIVCCSGFRICEFCDSQCEPELSTEQLQLSVQLLCDVNIGPNMNNFLCLYFREPGYRLLTRRTTEGARVRVPVGSRIFADHSGRAV